VNRPGAAPHRLPLAVLSVPKRIMKLEAPHGSYVRNAPESIARPPARRFPSVQDRSWLTARNAPVAISADPPRRARIFDELPRQSSHRGPTAAPGSGQLRVVSAAPTKNEDPSASPSAFVDVFEPLGLAEFCTANRQPCDALEFARRRAVLTPTRWDDHRLLAYVNTAINFNPLATPHLRALPESWRVQTSADTCKIMSLPKQRHLECLGLPGEFLRKKPGIASPMFKRAGLIPRGGGRYSIGKPYKISGRTFTPNKDPSYDRNGIASWYGADFHRRMTANGEWFDMEYFSAAHATMPLPSYARVTNLENGREMIVRVNDRGPFVGGRIIDLSKKCAEALEFKTKGIAKVRVQYVGPAPLDDHGSHLAAMNRELQRGTPLRQMIVQASGLLQQQAALAAAPPSSFTE
jgi:rare lipoprotein A (peptidoglycan hydrolase)